MSTSSRSTPPIPCNGTPETRCSHRHGPSCGHEAVPYGGHVDYLGVSGRLHHPYGNHDDHGAVQPNDAYATGLIRQRTTVSLGGPAMSA
jgi:hypothetical protein